VVLLVRIRKPRSHNHLRQCIANMMVEK
jgi:hypothetical protein